MENGHIMKSWFLSPFLRWRGGFHSRCTFSFCEQINGYNSVENNAQVRKKKPSLNYYLAKILFLILLKSLFLSTRCSLNVRQSLDHTKLVFWRHKKTNYFKCLTNNNFSIRLVLFSVVHVHVVAPPSAQPCQRAWQHTLANQCFGKGRHDD